MLDSHLHRLSVCHAEPGRYPLRVNDFGGEVGHGGHGARQEAARGSSRALRRREGGVNHCRQITDVLNGGTAQLLFS